MKLPRRQFLHLATGAAALSEVSSIATPAAAYNAALYDKLNFNFLRDIAPVAGVSREPQVLIPNPSVPAKTLPEFITFAKAQAGKIDMASGGIGTSPHMPVNCSGA
jgi:tripartite-type tricarboxylate transporter receptor subunit TctC